MFTWILQLFLKCLENSVQHDTAVLGNKTIWSELVCCWSLVQCKEKWLDNFDLWVKTHLQTRCEGLRTSVPNRQGHQNWPPTPQVVKEKGQILGCFQRREGVNKVRGKWRWGGMWLKEGGNPLERDLALSTPAFNEGRLSRLLRMGDHGGFNKFGGKWQNSLIFGGLKEA
jgi:hypothetical protein